MPGVGPPEASSAPGRVPGLPCLSPYELAVKHPSGMVRLVRISSTSSCGSNFPMIGIEVVPSGTTLQSGGPPSGLMVSLLFTPGVGVSVLGQLGTLTKRYPRILLRMYVSAHLEKGKTRQSMGQDVPFAPHDNE